MDHSGKPEFYSNHSGYWDRNRLHCRFSPEKSFGINRSGLRHFALRVDAIEPIAAAVLQRFGMAVEVIEVPADIVRGGKRMAYLRDPDGAIVELSQYAEAEPAFCG